MNRLFTMTALVCALSFGFTSCDKDEEVIATLSDSKAQIQEKSLVPTTDSIFFNIQTNAVVAKATADVSFAGTMSLDLSPKDAKNFRLGYFDSKITTLADIKLAVLDTANIKFTNKMTLAMINGPSPVVAQNAWYNYYFSNHTVAPIAGRYVILFKGNENTKYSNTLDNVTIFQLTEIVQNGRTADKVSFKTKVFTK